MTYDIITIGGSTYDITLYPSESAIIDNKNDILRQKLLAFEYGAKIKLNKIFFGFGGGAANTAVSLASLGFKAAVLTAIGNDDIGGKIIDNFKKRKVDTKLIQKKNGFTSDSAIIIVGSDKDRVIFFDDKTKDELRLAAKDIAALKNTKWIYINSLGRGWNENLEKIFKVKKRNSSVKIAWNPGQNQLKGGISGLSKFLSQTDILMLNQDEAIQLALSDPKAKKENRDLNNMENLMPMIKSYGAKITVITCGRDGAWAYGGEKLHHTLIMKEQRRADTTGVGDSFNSSFVAGLELFDGDIDKAMRLGVLNAAKNVAETGAQNGLLNKKDLRKLNI